MSTKSTLILSSDNEHIYYDCSDNTVNIEVDKKNIVEQGECEDGCYISIKADCDLARQIKQAYNDPNLIPRSMINDIVAANNYTEPEFLDVLNKATDILSCIHILHEVYTLYAELTCKIQKVILK